jgi:hypothetical protein
MLMIVVCVRFLLQFDLSGWDELPSTAPTAPLVSLTCVGVLHSHCSLLSSQPLLAACAMCSVLRAAWPQASS